MQALMQDALGKAPPAAAREAPPEGGGYTALSQTSQTGDSDATSLPPRGGSSIPPWLLAAVAVAVVVALALAWGELKRHCASGEERLWGYIRVPHGLRSMIAPAKPEAAVVEDPYFTPI